MNYIYWFNYFALFLKFKNLRLFIVCLGFPQRWILQENLLEEKNIIKLSIEDLIIYQFYSNF